MQGTSIGKGATPVPSSVTTWLRSVRRTVTAVRTTCLARSVWHKTQVACSPAKRMTGHLGDVTKTTQNLDVIRIDEARQLLLIKGRYSWFQGWVRDCTSRYQGQTAKGAN